MKTSTKLLITTAAFAIGFIGGLLIPRKAPSIPVKTQVDTLFIFDTISVPTPVYVSSRVVDTIKIPYEVTRTDTLWVKLPREERVYADSTYRAVVSGYEPSLDRIDIYRRTIEVHTKETKYEYYPHRWAIGIQGGVGVTSSGLLPYVGVGIQYNLITWGER